MIEEQQNTIMYQTPGTYEKTRYEKIHTVIFKDSISASKLVAREIIELIKKRNKEGKKCVLGLATGSSPIKVYEELIQIHKKEKISFRNVVTFNLDEYYPITKEDNQSFHFYMQENFFKYIDIKRENVFIPEGSSDLNKTFEVCRKYEDKINEYGGIDYQILGIGRTGHIGFNEPGSNKNSVTRLITLDHVTRMDAAKTFHNIQNVPKRAITMGISTILKSKRIVILGWGHQKSNIIQKTIECNITSNIPASYLQQHSNTTFVLDTESASDLARRKTPWLVKPCDWDLTLSRKAIVWLSTKLQKPILKLTDEDYNVNGLSDLLATDESAYYFNIKMFNVLQHTITGWPGGKPNADDSQRPERSKPAKKRIIIFSPHPDDDVISMGGTFNRLILQGHNVHVAYQTSGNISVSDAETLKFIYVMNKLFKNNKGYNNENLLDISEKLKAKRYNIPDEKIVLNIKSLIRQSESYGATRFYNLPDSNVHFLNLPFYESGKPKKFPICEKDINIVFNLIKKVKPHIIFAAGDLADPHGTHKTCLEVIIKALRGLQKESFMKNCNLWLYRGAWHEWAIHEINMAVPLSPDEVTQKRRAIFFHQSQKEPVMYLGEDNRQFWKRAEERNRETAVKYNKLGLAEYEAIEGFKRCDPPYEII